MEMTPAASVLSRWQETKTLGWPSGQFEGLVGDASWGGQTRMPRRVARGRVCVLLELEVRA